MVQRLLIAAIATITLSSCSGLKKVQKHGAMNITPQPLELAEKNGDVDVNYTLTAPKKFIKKGAQLVFTPKFTDGNNTEQLKDVVINGKKFERKELRAIKRGKLKPNNDALKIVATKEAMILHIDDNITFKPWMANSQLVGYTIYNNGRKKNYLYKQVMADGVTYTPKVVIIEQPEVIEEVAVLNKQDVAAIYFKINSSAIENKLDNNSVNLKSITDLIKQIKANNDAELTSITIVGIASPDGTFDFNNTLSKKRADIAKEYIVKNCGVNESLITTINIAEDWEGLGKLIQNSSLSDKTTLVSMINSGKSDAEKNLALRKSPNYKVLAKDYLPKLRRTVYQIFFNQISTGEAIIVPIEVIE